MTTGIELIGQGNQHLRKWQKLDASTIRFALLNRYVQPEWACFFEVADGTGMSKNRSADCVAMNMYNSRGLSVHGIEIKVSRSDLKRELDNADKADAIARYCDKWWIAAPRGMVDPNELPDAWGLIEVWSLSNSVQSQIRKQAQTLPAVPLTRSFVASMLRSSAKVNEAIIRKARADERSTMNAEIEQMVNRRINKHEVSRSHADKTIAALAEAGIDLTDWRWQPEKLARLLKIAETGALDSWGGLDCVASNLEKALELLKKIEGALK